MSLKDLFNNKSEQVVIDRSLESIANEVQSDKYIDNIVIDNNRYIPSVDFSNPANFARYGSAEKYYVDGIKNIYQHYPYDGSKKEKLEWRNVSSQIDLYIYDNIYPKTTGYINLSASTNLVNSYGFRYTATPTYISIKGGPNASDTGKISDSNIYDLAYNRESNLGITSQGNTVEFWLKDEVESSNPNYDFSYCIFDLWNGVTASANNYTRLTVLKTSGSNKLEVTYRSGSYGITTELIDYTFDSSTWHHYAVSFVNINSNDLEVSLYVDGELVKQNIHTAVGTINLCDNTSLIANIGCLRSHPVTANNSYSLYGSAYISMDDFRFWKKARTSQEIYRNWFTQVAGGANTDSSNTNLGVYLKFNEGIIDNTQINDLDKICLDYSGRISNGTIENYHLGCKQTTSAIDAYFNETKEVKDPIIFSTNPLVQTALNTYGDIGFQYDQTNVSSIYKSLPAWITEEAEKLQLGDLSNLIQIISSYFDILHLQIENISKIKNLDYNTNSEKPKPFANILLSSHDFDNLDLFTDSTLLEKVFSRNENSEFEESINEIKNSIYQNIYNNLVYIYKSKGTEKALRNLIRCFGIDDELIKINLYSNNTTYDISEKYTYSSVPKKFVDFNNPDRYDGVIYQKRKPTDTTNTISYIPSATDGKLDFVPITLQTEILFPKQLVIESDNYFVVDFVSSSLFGIHQADNDQDNYTWGSDLFNFQVYSVRTKIGSPDAYFKLTGSFNGSPVNLTSSIYKDLYNNEKWNLAVRIRPSKYDHANFASGSNVTDYDLEFVGFNSVSDQNYNSFALSATINQADMTSAVRANKRIYLGAHYDNFNTSSLLEKTDVKASSIRFWYDYLTNEELLAHSYESDNFGRQYPNWHPEYFLALTSSKSFTRADTLILHWDFANVSSSDANGQFIVEDVSSGSYLDTQEYGLSWFGQYAKYQYPGFGDEFLENDDQVVNKEYILSAKKQNFESLHGNDLVQTPDVDDIARTKDSRLVSYFLSIEKSMAQVVNDEILKWFATINNFNNLIGNPAERYNKEYSGMRQMREIFFKNVNNRLDFEKFFEFYKWIDSSLSSVVTQLIPATANSSADIRNIIESHALERNKYENKLPTIEFKGEPKSYPVVSHLNYNYREQAAYPNNLQAEENPTRYYNFKPLWLKQRVQRTDTVVETQLEPQNDIDREIIRQVINEKNIDKLPTLFSDGNAYEGRKDISRNFTKTYNFSTKNLYVLEDTIRPLNISNNLLDSRFIFAAEIAASSSEQQIIQPIKKKGNYSRVYEYLFTSGRTGNNKSFVDLEGNIQGSTGASLLGFTDRSLPVRRAYKNIIVERFSAPGGPEVNGRGFLDPAAEEYSVYNSLNYRNSRVRTNYNYWLRETSSIDPNYPSYHKVTKNATYIPIDTGSSQVEPYYDNWFVSHAIPRSDLQYSWITASVTGSDLASGYASEYPNVDRQFTFISSSKFGTFSNIPFVNYRYFGDANTDAALTDKIYNTTTNTISGGQQFGAFTYIHTHFYLTSLNGPYQYPSWKQIRNYENPLSILSRKNNNIIIQDVPKERTVRIGTQLVTLPSRKSDTFTSYKESPVTFNRPLVQKVISSVDPNVVEVTSSYDNNKDRFSNPDLVNRTGFGTIQKPEIYDVINKLDKEGIFDPKPEVVEAKYTTQIYPAKENTGLKEVRTKPNYDDFGSTASVTDIRSYWSDNYNIRKRAVETIDLFNYTTTSYAALTDFTGSIMGKYPVLHKISGNINASIYALDNLTGSSSDYTATLANSRTAGGTINSNLNLTMSYGGTSKGILAPYSLPEHRFNIMDPDYNLEDIRYLAKWDPDLQTFNDDNITRLNGPIYKLHHDTINNRLYAGGFFTSDVNGKTLRSIAYWDGTQWNEVGDGVTTGLYGIGLVFDIQSGSDGLYIGGFFDTSAGSSVVLNNVAKWDGSSPTLTSLGGGLGGVYAWGPISLVYSLLSNSSGLYVGGNFISSSAVTMNGIGRWNGTTWNQLGTNPNVGTSYPVSKIIQMGNDLIVAGYFFYVDYFNTLTNFIAKYTPSTNTWSGSFANNGLNGYVITLASSSNNTILVGGQFTATNDNTKILNGLATYDLTNNKWEALTNIKYNTTIYPQVISQSSEGLYVAIQNTALLDDAYNITLQNLTNKKSFALKSGLNNTVRDIIASGSSNKIYIAGSFTRENSRFIFQTQEHINKFESHTYNGYDRLMPRPVLLMNNHIISSTGSDTNGNIITDYNKETNIIDTSYNDILPEALYIINEGYIYDLNNKAGSTVIENTVYNKKPFYNSYHEFINDIKPNTKQYSIVPEYKISDLMEYYVKDQNGNFNHILTSSYLSIDGLSIQNNFTDINSTLNKSSILDNFVLQDNQTFNNKKITLNLSGIKKLLPYNGFYPSERVKDLSSKFINSFLDLKKQFISIYRDIPSSASYNTSNKTPIDQQILTLMQPLFAPGVLLNTIKSSIAVDWPTFITNSVTYNSSTKPSFYNLSGSSAINHTATYFIDKEPNYRFPFESLLEFDVSIPTDLKTTSSNLYYLNPTYYSTDVISGSDRAFLRYPSYNMSDSGSLKSFNFNNADYKLAMHNFLAEIPNFFLRNGLSKYTSAPEDKFQSAISGVTYYMDVVLKRDSNHKDYIADPYYEAAKLIPSNHASGTILTLSPDSLYGPPVRYWNNISASALTSSGWYNLFFKQIDSPSYAPYVPPYYYGEARARLSFIAEETRQYSLEEIQQNLNIEFINSGATDLFAQRSNFISSSFTTPYSDNYSSSPAYKAMMTLSSSINFLLKTENNQPEFDAKNSILQSVRKKEFINPSWVIQTKFETPSLNFANVDKTTNLGLNFIGGNKNQTYQFVEGIYSNLFKGLWTTYGVPSDASAGIKMFIDDPYPYVGPQLMRQFKTGSLIQLCGFRKDEKRTIGLLDDEKQISEGVVIIPYTYTKNHGDTADEFKAITIPEIIGENGIYNNRLRGSGPYYFEINRDTLKTVIGLSFDVNSKVTFEEIKARVNSAEVDQNNSIVKLVKAMTKYSFPPHLDWLRNKNINPFVMYVADFTTKLDTEDLADIWQGIMPKPSYRAEKENISISHNFDGKELFHGRFLPNDLKFKVFKVKQKAEINYYKLTEDLRDDARFKFDFENSKNVVPEYSYNWPYDYFSLVELVNIEATLTANNEQEQPKETIINPEEIVKALQNDNPQLAIKSLGDKITKKNKKVIK